MGSAGSLSIGPFTLPVWLLVVAGCLGLASLAASLPLRKHRHVRSRIMGLTANAVIAFAAAWKLAPALLHPRALFSDPLPLLMAAPGPAGLVAGSVAAAVTVSVGLWRSRRLRRVALLPLALFAGVTAATAGTAELSFAAARRERAAPGLSLPLLGGGEVSLGELEGRVVVVNFWATWCPPCRAELPELVAFDRASRKEEVTLLAVNLASTEKSEDEVRSFVEERRLPFAVPLDRTGAAANAWGVRVVPTTFVVSPRGILSAVRTGAVDAAWLRRAVRRAGRGPRR